MPFEDSSTIRCIRRQLAAWRGGAWRLRASTTSLLLVVLSLLLATCSHQPSIGRLPEDATGYFRQYRFGAGTYASFQAQQSYGRSPCSRMAEEFGGQQVLGPCFGEGGGGRGGRAGGRGCFRKQLVLRGGGAQEKIADIEKEMRRTQKNKVSDNTHT